MSQNLARSSLGVFIRRVFWLAVALSAVASILSLLSAGALPCQSSSYAPQVDVYDPDPEHLWNRLYAAPYVRGTATGLEYGHDELDPQLWPNSKYLLAGPDHRHAIAVLDEFLSGNGHELVKDPLRQAFLQRDLWAIFDWSADPFHAAPPEPGELLAGRRVLQTRLAQAIRRLAMAPEQIAELPDNYAAAVRAEIFPPHHDPDLADVVFLPPDLLDPSGPWVLLEQRGRQLAAPAHVGFFRGRSAFLVLMNLPEGRAATLEYLEKLRMFPNPLMPRPADTSGRPFQLGPILNPELPQFSVRTHVALVRQMLLIDDQGKLTPTRITESVQIRVYRDIPKGNPSGPQLQPTWQSASAGPGGVGRTIPSGGHDSLEEATLQLGTVARDDRVAVRGYCRGATLTRSGNRVECQRQRVRLDELAIAKRRIPHLHGVIRACRGFQLRAAHVDQCRVG